jgi:alkylresorcinol/alkylpyrone synthase/polyketide synthase Type III
MTLAIHPTVAGIGAATPDTAYTKRQIIDLFDIKDRRTALLFRNSGIDRRFLSYRR